MRIVTIIIWLFLYLYLPEVIGIDKNVYFYLIGFPIALIGIVGIDSLFKKKRGEKK